MNFFDASLDVKARAVPVMLGLGSNCSFDGKSSLELLKSACLCLAQRISNIKYSSVYKTAAMYYENQPDFYNTVVSGFFKGSPFELLDFIQKIEFSHGRNRAAEFRNGPRSMDIDIEFFGRETVSSSSLQIPHPRFHERAFVLIPMLEIFPSNAEVFNIERDYLEQCLAKLSNQEVQKLPLLLGEGR